MRNICLILLLASSLSTFGQGKVSFGNNSDRYFVLGDTLFLPPADRAIGGGVASTANNTVSGAPGAIPVSPLPSGITLVAALYAGTTANNMTLQKSVVLDSAGWFQAGRMVNQNVILTGIPGGAPAFFQIYVYDNSYATPQAAFAVGSAYWGTSGQFTATPGFSITYPNLFAGGPANSTWGPGNIVIAPFPEPSTFALLALACAAAMVCRRKVSSRN